ncbi:hypothetical protein PHYSODRAFT_262246 [Phytophthora sojae]|uniref:Secreted protein n=1 Tax=Phytophthora sojae (strain P6497) TaxID=1094619 RepID=G4YE13_PHYSP|nr:hypothetical protein PHYSODRAFT_262246 [Phytophthora sojae]EGZ29031.1 hypothetical protein PHYSODRAFT_262246 [Phytophthora sojae]|eukprot:XP_009516306.1 hypothetical protein PHYSODRAFT_262246 [Phytophthora sojae]
MWHWSNQMTDLVFCFFVICINASVSPALTIFLAKPSDALDMLVSGDPNESTLKFGVVGVLALRRWSDFVLLKRVSSCNSGSDAWEVAGELQSSNVSWLKIAEVMLALRTLRRRHCCH